MCVVLWLLRNLNDDDFILHGYEMKWILMNIENVHQMLIVLDDTVLEEHHVSPSLVQMSLIGEGGEEMTISCLQPFVSLLLSNCFFVCLFVCLSVCLFIYLLFCLLLNSPRASWNESVMITDSNVLLMLCPSAVLNSWIFISSYCIVRLAPVIYAACCSASMGSRDLAAW